jgi:hypothetical protein
MSSAVASIVINVGTAISGEVVEGEGMGIDVCRFTIFLELIIKFTDKHSHYVCLSSCKHTINDDSVIIVSNLSKVL